jgi:hypothetical protein
MRLMHIPSRVTLGYQGGRLNDYGDYLIVRNSDAHAWSEIWVAEKSRGLGHWQRVDPTSVVAPLRLTLGGEYNQIDGQLLAKANSEEEIHHLLNSGLSGLEIRFELAWDAMQMQWNGFLMHYDFDYQRSLLSRIGFADVSRFALFLFLGVSIIIFVVTFNLVLRRRAKAQDPVLSIWIKFCRRLDKAGISRRPTEGPWDFARRAAKSRPDLESQIIAIAQNFIDLRYGSPSSDELELRHKISRLRHSVRRFSIKAISRSASS